MDNKLFCLPEQIRNENYIVATYYIKLRPEIDILEKAAALAVGQTIGTWVAVPGITEQMRKKYMGKVVQVIDVPAVELENESQEQKEYILKIAYPTENFGNDFPLMLTALLGNDASTSAQVKLIDIEFPDIWMAQFAGPKFGIDGIRALTGIRERPLVLNMIKPCTGLKPAEGARIFYETALGGIDMIKDDELLGNPSYSKPRERVVEYKKAARAAYEHTGKMTKYFVNITSGAGQILEQLERVVDAGADGIMVNFSVIGYSMMMQIAEKADIPILGHGAGSGMYCEGIESGMSSPLAVGKLARIAGADMVMVNTPYGGYPLRAQKYMQTLQQLVLPCCNKKPSMPVIGGGVHPGMAEFYVKSAGNDIVLAAGGAVQGHPMGATAGAKAMMQAVEAVGKGRSIKEAADEQEELKQAVLAFGIKTI